MRKQNTSKKLNCIRKMPPLYHTIPGEDFDIEKSVVINWLLRKPEVLNYLWDHIKQSGYIKYDKYTGKWQGVDYDRD